MEQGPREQQGADRVIGLGYPGMQLARALARAEQCQEPQEQARAQAKADQWSATLFGILSGGIRPGSRTPVRGLPAWVTLQVVTGGFATGDVLSGGPLHAHERALLETLGLQRLRGDAGRHALNTWFLTEEGQQQLGQWLQSGCYEVRVPEEGALLVIHGLACCGQFEAARALLDVLVPYFGRMRVWGKLSHPGWPLATHTSPSFFNQAVASRKSSTRSRLLSGRLTALSRNAVFGADADCRSTSGPTDGRPALEGRAPAIIFAGTRRAIHSQRPKR